MSNMFGNTLRNFRMKSGIGLRELARMIDKSPGYISDVELERVPPPSEEVILKMADALGVAKNELLTAARKVDPELSDYVLRQPNAADFLRLAKERDFDNEDWERLAQLAEISRLGRQKKEEK
jgi:transcriptional regulator with XRE-family HTH domain